MQFPKSGIVEFDLSSDIEAIGYKTGYSTEDPPKEFYVYISGGQIDMRVFIIGEEYGYHFNQRMHLFRPSSRRNSDKFDVCLVLDYQPERAKGRWKNVKPTQSKAE